MSGPTLALTAAPAVTDPAASLLSLRSVSSHSSTSANASTTTTITPPTPLHDSLSGLTHPLPSWSAASSSSSSSTPLRHDRSLSVKSLPSLPGFEDGISLDFYSDLDTSFSLTYDDIKRPIHDCPAPERRAILAAGLAPSSTTMGPTGKKRSILARPVSWMPSSKGSPGWDELDLPTADDSNKENTISATNSTGSSRLDPRDIPDRPRASSTSLSAAFSRRSWLGSSARTPSPNTLHDPHDSDKCPPQTYTDIPPPPPEPVETPRALIRSATETSLNKLRKSARKTNGGLGNIEGSKSTDSMGKLGGYFSRKKAQVVPPRALVLTGPDSTGSSTTSLAPPSIEARPSHASETSNSTAPDDIGSTPKPAMARDPLWSLFKGLETDHAKFQSKSVTAKATLVRSTLLPFLRNFHAHPSNKQLHPTDLEKRAIILNSWWGGILDMLAGKEQQVIPGVDKPSLFEAMTFLMTRPEWRFSTPSFCALGDRSPKERLRKRLRSSPSASSQESFGSSDALFVADSADHNIRTMFTNKLVAQLVFVVEKLSNRHAPVSLVNFSGKACAYAFFFCPDVANLLVRMWGLTADQIRRVADEFNLPRRSKGESDDIVALFPANLGDLGWNSVKSSADLLKTTAPPPLGTARTSWYGPWVSRWKGRDTDLFFVFCKYYFILAEDFMPAGLPLIEKARSPAFVLVNAQILSVLDATVHRQAPAGPLLGPPLMDAQGADASLLSMPLAPNNNAFRGMSENRLVVLLRDILCSASTSDTQARHTFAESFMAVMKSSAKRTSQFNHNACFTICDFLEESLPIINEYNKTDENGMVNVDWQFWIDVLNKILESNNTMSEIRVMSLLFSIWDTITSEPSRKEAVCHGWLLKEEVFNKYFNNWCPMIRAYYMRLLCWRICRDAGIPNELDTKIFLTVWARLKVVWSHYLWLRQSAEYEGKFLPSTAPSYPTPGKRFMIIRHEVAAPQPGLALGFDQFSHHASQVDVPSGPATSFDAIEILEDVAPPQYKKKWGLFGKVLTFSGSNPTPEDLETLRRETAHARARPAPPAKSNYTSDTFQRPASDGDSMGSSPIYEAVQYVFKFTLSWNAPGTPMPLHRILGRPRLPGPAQAVVNSRDRTAGPAMMPAASRPAVTRAVSGSISSGLIELARNAEPIESAPNAHRPSDDLEKVITPDNTSPDSISPDEQVSHGSGSPLTSSMHSSTASITYPVEPTGDYAMGVKYAGRALAEWGLVVGEYNGFVDRRRDEGVMGLSEVEVPSLGVEGFRKH